MSSEKIVMRNKFEEVFICRSNYINKIMEIDGDNLIKL